MNKNKIKNEDTMDKLDTIECVGIGWPEEGGCCGVFVEYRRLGRGRSGDEKAPQGWAKPPGAQNRGGIWGLCILAPPLKKWSRWGGRDNPRPSTISQSNRMRDCKGNRWWNHGPENERKPRGDFERESMSVFVGGWCFRYLVSEGLQDLPFFLIGIF